MKTIYEYLLESLVDFKELRNDLKFELCSYDEITEILDTDEFSHGTELGFDNVKDMKNEAFLFYDKNAKFYKLMYKKYIIGITGLLFLKDGIENHTESSIINDIISCLLKSNNFFDKNIFKNHDKIYDETAYIILLQLSKDKKKNLDINPIAGIKVFYEKLIKYLKDNGIKYLIAHGKDKKVMSSYIKVGGFESFNDKYSNEYIRNKYKEISEIYEHCVVKKI